MACVPHHVTRSRSCLAQTNEKLWLLIRNSKVSSPFNAMGSPQASQHALSIATQDMAGTANQCSVSSSLTIIIAPAVMSCLHEAVHRITMVMILPPCRTHPPCFLGMQLSSCLDSCLQPVKPHLASNHVLLLPLHATAVACAKGTCEVPCDRRF